MTSAPPPPPALPARRRRWVRRTVLIISLILLACVVKYVVHMSLPHHFTGSGDPLPLALPGGAFQTLYFNGDEAPRGIVILGTGSGGWSAWEEKVARHLAGAGYAVGGWDCRAFADSRSYDQAGLVEGFKAAVAAVADRAEVKDVPVWYGGWSTGAEQAVAAVGSSRLQALVGLLLIAPAARGRYGMTESDLLGLEPEGPGSFALADFIDDLQGLGVAQFAAGLDPLDDTDWYPQPRPATYQIFELPRQLHDMGGAGDKFLNQLDQAMAWSLRVKESP